MKTVHEAKRDGTVARVFHRSSSGSSWTHAPGERYRYRTRTRTTDGRNVWGWVERRCDCSSGWQRRAGAVPGVERTTAGRTSREGNRLTSVRTSPRSLRTSYCVRADPNRGSRETVESTGVPRARSSRRVFEGFDQRRRKGSVRSDQTPCGCDPVLVAPDDRWPSHAGDGPYGRPSSQDARPEQ